MYELLKEIGEGNSSFLSALQTRQYSDKRIKQLFYNIPGGNVHQNLTKTCVMAKQIAVIISMHHWILSILAYTESHCTAKYSQLPL